MCNCGFKGTLGFQKCYACKQRDIAREVDSELLDFVRRVVAEQLSHGDHGDRMYISEGQALIRKAGG